MGTSLSILTNSKLTGNETIADCEVILKKLKNLKLTTTSYRNAKNETIKESGDWSYELFDEHEYLPFSIEFSGPFSLTPVLYKDSCLIESIYRYSLLYQIYNLDWFKEFRQDLFQIILTIGGTEAIYLADNGCDKLCYFLDNMVTQGISYEEIKSKMIMQLGQPVADYSKLDYEKLDYKKINEFFLDDFKDLQ